MLVIHYINFLLFVAAATTAPTAGLKMLCGFGSAACLIVFLWEVYNETSKDSCV